MKLHLFGETRAEETAAAAVYAVVHQDSGIIQGLRSAKARIAIVKKTFPEYSMKAVYYELYMVSLELNQR